LYAAAVVEFAGTVRGMLCGTNKIVNVDIGVCQRKGWVREGGVSRYRIERA
jgi:hypothetical protein